MTVRVAPILVSLAGVGGACALASAELRMSVEASSELRLQPVEQPPALEAPGPLGPPRPWEFGLDLIFWWPWDSNADATAQNVLAAVDVTAGDLIDEGETYVPQARFDAWNNMGWGIEAAVTWHTLNSNGAPGRQGNVPLGTLVDTEIEWVYFDLSLGFRVLDSPADSTGFGAAQVDMFAGVRYSEIDIEHTAQSNQDTVQDSDEFFDPIFGVRSSVSIRDDMWWITRFDVGGAVGADAMILLETGLEVNLSGGLNLLVGYRLHELDYDDGEGASTFGLNGTFHGPYLGLNLNF